MNRPKGFSLIELLVVIAIIGLLSTMAVVSLNNARQKARDARRMGDIKAISTAVELYKSENDNDYVPGITLNGGDPAGSWTELGAALRKYISGGIPVDPGSNAYVYCYPDTGDTDNLGKYNRYLVAAVLETVTPTAGDIDDTNTLYKPGKCISSPLPVQVPALTAITISDPLNCADGAGNIYASNQNVYCLGYTLID